MFIQERRQVIKALFGFSLLSLLPMAIPFPGKDRKTSKQLVMVDGWVLLRSDLEAG